MSHNEKARKLVSQMTLEEKASLCSGKDFWYLKSVERLGLPSIMVTDGPHGVRKQVSSSEDLGISKNVPAVCFPTAVAMACSFNRELIREVGSAIGEECRQEGVAVLLGPGINIKRSPLCGRNFEYFSEDPLVSGHLAAAFIEGVQSQAVGTSLKHYAANNQEKRRLTIDAVMDERTFRELYLAGFEYAVKHAQPWTVMCSYNQVFGEFASESERLLTTILRDEWGFAGLVVSDWGAVVDRVRGVIAGLDLQMPHLDDTTDQRLADAARAGTLSMQALDSAAERVCALILRAQERKPFTYDVNAHRSLARRAAAQSAVLLKNDDDLLPVKPGAHAAVIGAFAAAPRYQGTGSSRITPIKVDSALDEFRTQGLDFEFAAGYREESDEPDEALIEEARRIATGKDIVFIFAGLPDRYEAETFDRDSLAMPPSHNRLIEAVREVNENVSVILYCGGVVEVPWADKVKAILLMHLGGEAVSLATVDVLLGKVNPPGKLAESWPDKLEDNPSFANFPGYPLTVEYREGLFVGYRYYDKAEKPVRYPFGFGLSYTTFGYHDLALSARRVGDDDELFVSCKITNTGSRAGNEVVQLYLAKKGSVIIRPEQELKGFVNLSLLPGESQEARFKLTSRDLAYYNTDLADWHVENGEYEVRIAASSRDVRLRDSFTYAGSVETSPPDLREQAPCYYNLGNGIRVSDAEFTTLLGRPIPPRERVKGSPFTINSTITDIQENWVGRIINREFLKQVELIGDKDPFLKLMAEKIFPDMPLRFLTMVGSGGLSIIQVEGLVDLLNGKYWSGFKKFRKSGS